MRRYDLDWLRVIVFGLLILYHVGMFFVPWGFHIKNDIIYPDIRWPMYFVNQWRLPILFVISGMGTFYALSKRTGGQFILERIKRLFIPLVFGMMVIVPPQVYFERLDKGQFSGAYFEFWPLEAFNGVYPEGNLSWHHLWFLPYLLVFSIMLAPVFLYLRKNTANAINRFTEKSTSGIWRIYLFILPLYLWESLLEPFFPSTHALIDDWFNFVNYLTLFFYGFLLVSRPAFWDTVVKYRQRFLFNGILGFILLVGIRILYEDSVLIHFIEALFKVFNLWSWILVLFGYAAFYLNKPSSGLAYANQAVYPFYILHQTITITLGYYLMHLTMGFWPKFLLMSIGTFGFSWLIYEYLIRPWKWIRPLFGVKRK